MEENTPIEKKEEEKNENPDQVGNEAHFGEDPNCPKCREFQKDKKIKNLISLAILLAGLFVGSLYVDMAQLVKGSGYSAKNLNASDIFEANDKTWVAYSDPAVPVSIITDDSCQNCDPSEAIVWLRRVLPTVSTQKVAYDSDEGKQLISEFAIKSLPAFIFDKNIDQTEFYSQAKVLFNEKDGKYVMDTNQLGLPAGKYLATPQIDQGDATFGNADSKVKVVVFSDFQCPYCKVFYTALRDTMKSYGDKVQFAFKELPLDIHPEAAPAALASQCALEQGKFWEYGDKLYATQNEWGSAKDTTVFKNYAKTVGLDANKFNQCLDNKKYQANIDANKKEAADFGIAGTPAIFVGDKFESGAITADQLKADIDAQLAK